MQPAWHAVVLQTSMLYPPTAEPMEQCVLLLTMLLLTKMLGAAPPWAVVPAEVVAVPLEQLALLLKMLLLMKILGAAPPWAVVAAAVVAVPAASCPPPAGSDAPQWAVVEWEAVAALTVVAAAVAA